MRSIRETKAAGAINELIAFGDYEWPRSEAQQTIGHLLEKLKLGFNSGATQSAIESNDLRTVSNDAFERAARDALSASLKVSLDLQYRDWASSNNDQRSQRLLVHPPMELDILATWAADLGLPIVEEVSQFDVLSDARCVVIPKLEQFFARRHDRLDRLIELSAKLSNFKGRVLVGCNSWAVQFLRQFDDALLMLGLGDTFPPFDADALAAILEQAAEDKSTFVSVASGEPVFERDENGELCDPFLQKLAERSLGHPWVAIEMFFQGIAEAKDEDKDTSDKRAWVQLPTACTLPNSNKDVLLFALHSLLIHGTRRIAEFDDLLPQRLPNGVWPTLERAGYVDLKDGFVSCAIRSYPDIRSELSAAGFNLDKL